MNITFNKSTKEELHNRFGKQISIGLTRTAQGCHRFKEDIEIIKGITNQYRTTMIIRDEIIFHIDVNIITRTNQFEISLNEYNVIIIKGIKLI